MIKMRWKSREVLKSIIQVILRTHSLAKKYAARAGQQRCSSIHEIAPPCFQFSITREKIDANKVRMAI